ncbi:hypothetical protein [Microbacterium sp. H83]|uniref:hypothetical protein n=1 Tax=Microbacterium sp. H83 TaxID=1827324 RepID=UPI0007F45171|nr:hypothetical protein [Microbacterium sp. H83]OAN38333.1 hypothetical protein A4X16_02795 [Microbacterium sp. H83]
MSLIPFRVLLVAASVVVLAVSGCAAGSGSSPAPTSPVAGADGPLADPAPPHGRVVAAGTVLDRGGDASLCLGAVAESYPPQCSGIPLVGWSWDGVDGSETSGDTTWGGYAVRGTYDGETFTVTDAPIMLALYDPIRSDDPAGGVDGSSDQDDLARVQTEVGDALGTDALTTWIERGYVWVQVVWDDGSLQRAVDERYGDGVVIVTSAVLEVD